MKQYFPILILAFTILACAVPTTAATPAPIQPQLEPGTPDFVGLWMSETETLVFTENSLYRVLSNAGLGQTNEQFAEIISYDPANGHITVRTQWIKVNGGSVGFDAPTYNLTYKIDGDILQIGRGTDTDFATVLDLTLYQRK